MSVNSDVQLRPRPASLRAVLELLKPITWFPPMWAYLCGIVSAGVWTGSDWTLVLLGILLAGPVVCGMSQAANDWCDRHVDAINEPGRPIPSGRVPAPAALAIALAMSLAALVVAWPLGPWGFGATIAAVAAAWAYSLPPLRLKRSALWGPGLVGLCYEGLPWFTGAAVISAGAPGFPVIATATLYAIGAHGIMTLNDFKAVAGDRATGIRSLPVVKGPEVAARIACVTMALPQALVATLLLIWGAPVAAGLVALSLALQMRLMGPLLGDPEGQAARYAATGVTLYVLGMMVAAVALRGV